MKRPSFQFYPGDWQANSNLRRCTHEEKGAWVDILCLLHDSEEYGILRWPLKEISQAIGAPLRVVKSIVNKGVLKGSDADQKCAPFVYIPRSGRKLGDPVTLLDEQDGPIWYSSRMVKDEYVRKNAGAATRFGANQDEGKGPTPAPRRAKEGSERAKLRAKVLAKTGGACHHCGEVLGDVWEIDHLMPRAKGGRHTFDNMVPSCVDCNQDKSDTLPDDWTSPKSSPSRRVGEWRGELQGDGSSSSSSSSASHKNKNTARVPRFDAQAHLVSLGVPIDLAKDWLAVRKAKRLAPTATAFDDAKAEADKAGIPFHDALRTCIVRGWGGFKASWLDEKPSGRMNGHGPDDIFG